MLALTAVSIADTTLTLALVEICPSESGRHFSKHLIAWEKKWPHTQTCDQQESPAVADKPARRESLPKIGPIRRADNVVADNTGLSSFA